MPEDYTALARRGIQNHVFGQSPSQSGIRNDRKGLVADEEAWQLVEAMIDFENAQGLWLASLQSGDVTDVSSKSMRSYPIGTILPVPDIGRLVLFDAYPARDVVHSEILGREVFLFDDGNRPVWQIAAEPGSTDDMHRNFDATRLATDTFSVISNIDGRYYASRIGGDTFVIDMATGAASYSGWART